MSEETERAAGLTDTGLTRTHNEDAFRIEPPLYAVADGMGGHRAGEVASTIALEALMAEAPRAVDAKALGRAIRIANRAVIDTAEQSRSRTGMGTTLTAVMTDGAHLVVGHVGDSRAYLLHGDRLQQLTEDHSMVADLVRSGSLSKEDARLHPQRSVITRALGSDPNMFADVFEVDADPGDRLLLCTDGLTSMLPDEHLAEILRDQPDPEAAVRALTDAANRAGGVDNITAVVVDLGETPAAGLGPRPGTVASGRRFAARLLWLVAALALVAATAYGAHAFARSRAYLVEEGGVVVVYRGVPGSFAGVSLSWLVERTDVPVSRLTPLTAQRLKVGMRYASLEDALARVTEWRGSLDSTRMPSGEATPSPSP